MVQLSTKGVSQFPLIIVKIYLLKAIASKVTQLKFIFLWMHTVGVREPAALQKIMFPSFKEVVNVLCNRLQTLMKKKPFCYFRRKGLTKFILQLVFQHFFEYY